MFSVQNCERLGYEISLSLGVGFAPALRLPAQRCPQTPGRAASGHGGSFCGSVLEVQVSRGLGPWVGLLLVNNSIFSSHLFM